MDTDLINNKDKLSKTKKPAKEKKNKVKKEEELDTIDLNLEVKNNDTPIEKKEVIKNIDITGITENTCIKDNKKVKNNNSVKKKK